MLAKEQASKNKSSARKRYWENLTPEAKEKHLKHLAKMRAKLKAKREKK